jgi:xanthine dehydrogenase accessory factor
VCGFQELHPHVSQGGPRTWRTMAAMGSHDEHQHPEVDPACAMAHGTLASPATGRRLVAVFDSPVARELADLAARAGWEVVLLDPRHPTEPLPAALHATTTAEAGLHGDVDVVVCDHDRPELGDVLAEVLRHDTRWVGVMGSPRHSAPHVAALQERGVPQSDVDRVHRPIGLDIGSRSPVEIAISTVAGLLADRNGRAGGVYAAG